MEVKWVQKIALTLTLAEKNTCLEYLKMENFAFLWKWVYVGLCFLRKLHNQTSTHDSPMCKFLPMKEAQLGQLQTLHFVTQKPADNNFS